MVSDDDDLDCPLCMEEFDIADRNFRPCPCGYQICRFCWHHIKTNLNGRCPACRRMYSDQIVEFIPVSADEIARIKKEKKEKERQQKEMKDPKRRQLSNVRVVQKNLVYVLGLPSKYASADNEFFKKYGKISKLVVSRRAASNGQISVGIYVTYAKKEDAAKAIAGINGSVCDGRTVRASYGTTKYCTYYLRHMTCTNPNCMYLHEPGDDVDSINKENVTIGKHANTNAPANPPYPNKRPAAVLTAQKMGIRPSSSTETSQSESTTRKSAWAPIPKVVPQPPPVAKERATEEMEVEPEPAAKTPSPKQQRPAAPAAKPIAIQKKDDKPALPAGASWGRGINNTQTMASSVESATTPINFGPSLSDAAAAPQKPKHSSPSIPRKKEKKLKSKMVRLEDFEESMRTGKAVASKAKSKKARQRQENEEEEPQRTSIIEARDAESTVDASVSQPVEDVETEKEAPSTTNMEEEALAPASIAPTNDTAEAPESADKKELEDVQKEVHPPMEEERSESEHEDSAALSRLDDGVEDNFSKEQSSDDQIKPSTVEQEEHIDASKKDYATEQPSFANYILGDLVMDQVEEDGSDLYEAQGGLSSLKSDIDSESDPRFEQDFGNDEFDMERSEKIQEEDHVELAPSPMLVVDRLNSLADQEFDSPEQVERQMFNHPPQAINNAPSPMEDQGRPPMGAHGPPPGLGAPVAWRAQQAFDPFFGQDPNIIAARRLQHSQRMLEASGLFHGFGRPAPPPPPPPTFGMSPDFNASGTPPVPQRNHGPPPGFFGPPPQHPPGPMMRRPDFVNPPPGMEGRNMESLENGMQGLSLYRQVNEQERMREETVRSMQEDFRAMLPNVKISFGPLRDEHIYPPITNSPGSTANKPHTPGEEETNPSYKQLRSNSTIDAAHNIHHDPSSIVNSQQIHGSAVPQEKISDESPPGFKRHGEIPFAPTQKPNANADEVEHQNMEKDVKEEARHFFGEFLRKAAATSESNTGKEAVNNDSPLPFQDPAIMSVRMNNAGANSNINARQEEDRTESQKAILQILGGRLQQQQQQPQVSPMDPPMQPPNDFGQFDMFKPPSHQLPINYSQAQQLPPFHQRHHPRPPPPPFMSGMGDPTMNRPPPPPPPFHPPHHPMHEQSLPPGLMPPPNMPISMQMELGFRPHHGNIPPELFPGRGPGGM